ncbi:MAG: hypothetical protein IJH77_05305, partial [Mogibacterium sp.]|nr:hypothetical protein [Mogibacterium sp.]
MDRFVFTFLRKTIVFYQKIRERSQRFLAGMEDVEGLQLVVDRRGYCRVRKYVGKKQRSIPGAQVTPALISMIQVCYVLRIMVERCTTNIRHCSNAVIGSCLLI